MAKAKRGRKPSGDFTGKLSNFSTRIQPQTRKALEHEAKTAGLSISQLAQRLLVNGLAKRRENERDKAMRALCFVIAETAHQAVGIHVTEGKTDVPASSWRSDPFFYRAFKLAVIQILDALEPKGEIKPLAVSSAELERDSAGAEWLQSFKSPEARAKYAAGYVLNSLETIPRLTIEEREEERRFLERVGSPSHWREFYGMPDAARDLEIEARGKTIQKTFDVLVDKKNRGKADD